MHHLRRSLVASKSHFSLAHFHAELAAARASHATPAGLSRSLVSASPVGGTTEHKPDTNLVFYYVREPADSSSTLTHSSAHSHRGFAAQSASRLKQSANRAKRIAQQQHGGRQGPLPAQSDPTSNEAVATIPQEHTTVQANQGQASQLQVRCNLSLSCASPFTGRQAFIDDAYCPAHVGHPSC